MKKQSLPVNLGSASSFSQRYPWVKLQAWFMENRVKNEMVYKGGAEDQILFMRDQPYYLFKDCLEETCVVGTHRSKSIDLPVYQLSFTDGTVLTLRDNFHDWKVSVESPIDLHFPTSLFSGEGKTVISTIYCEGFTDDQVFGPYSESQRRFTVEIYDMHRLFTFFFLLHEQMKNGNIIKDLSDSLERTSDRLRMVLEAKTVRDADETLEEARHILKKTGITINH